MPGTVFDPQQQVVPGATVVITDESTGVTREAQTDAQGLFEIPNLRPGTYAVTATLTGFRKTQRTGVVLRAADGNSHARSAMCNLCHTMQPADQVALFTARKAGVAGSQGDSVGTYICRDLSCHENVRLAAPLAPSEIRGSVDLKIDGTRRRTEAFVERVLEGAAA